MPHTKVPVPSKPVDVEDQFGSGRNDIFYAAIQRSRMPMILTDPHQPDNPIVFHNDAFEELTGYSEEEITGKNCRFLQGPRTDRAVVKIIANSIRESKDCTVELLNYRKDGSQFWNALFVSPVFDEHGALRYFFASQLDVSRRREAEETLRRSQRIETLGQLTGGIAHDFNNMLMVITGNIKMATEADGEKSKAGHLDRAMAAAKSANKLTQQLLSFARKQQLKNETVDINQIVFSVRDMLERVLGSDVRLSCELDPSIWQVRVDKGQAENAFVNVLLNARDALVERGGNTVERLITVTTERCYIDASSYSDLVEGDYVSVSFTDNGEGMPETVRDRVFEPFFTTKDQGKGTGMGMAMVYGFAKQSGGSVTVTSTVGEGTTVRFLFPATGEGAVPATSKETRVLVVEDNEQVRALAVEYLRAKGFGVRHADSAADALAMIESGYVPNVLFTDIVMPGVEDGVTLAKIVRTRFPAVKILLTSGWSNNQLDIQDKFELIAKPYDLDTMAEKIGELAKLTVPAAMHEG